MLYFGSFNPIHNGHVALARYALANAGVDELWLVVSPRNPLKSGDELWDDDLRLRMARAGVQGYGIMVSGVEFGLPRPNYTFMTLRHLREEMPDVEFSLLIGADNCAIFDRWRNYGEILAEHEVWVYPREGVDVDLSRFPQMKRIDAPLFPISSTMIRAKIASGESISGLVPQEVEDIIREQYTEYQG